MRGLLLYIISLKAAAHRLRHDLARELVVAICGVVLLATFWYVFNDFLNVEVRNLSTNMRDAFATAGAGALLFAALATAQRLVRAERTSDDSLRISAWRLGEAPRILQVFMCLRYLSIVAACFGVAWYVIYRWLIAPPMGTAILVQIGLLIVLLIWQWLAARPRPTTEQVKDLVGETSGSRSALMVMVRWRLLQMLRRNRTTRLCLGIAAMFGLIAIYSAIRGAPPAAMLMSAFASGVFLATAMAFQLAEDLQYAWAERCLGVSHELFVKTYYVIGALLSISFGLVTLLCILAGVYLQTRPELSLLSLYAKVPMMMFVPCYLLPQIGLQIDGRRPAIQIMMLILFGLFVVTAIYAHWLSVILLPLLPSFTEQNQRGHFYRA